MTSAGARTLALDDMLCDPEFPAVVERIRAEGPAGFFDQLDAATRDVELGTEVLIRSGAATAARSTPYREVPGWARLGLLDALSSWVSGGAATCLHAPHPSRPQPVLSAAWRPGRVACVRCVHLLVLPPGSDADRRCDGCGRLTTGVEHGDGVWPVQLQMGPLIHIIGCCSACRWFDLDQTEAR